MNRCNRVTGHKRPGGRFAIMLALAAASLSGAARSEFQIDITKGFTDPFPIAIIPFAGGAAVAGGFDFAAVVQHDLDGSGRFKSMPRRAVASQPVRAADVVAADWHANGEDYVLVGRVNSIDATRADLDCELVNALTGQVLGNRHLSANSANPRAAAHQVSDFVYEKILGARGAFATRIAYVAVNGAPPAQHFQLFVADADGENAQIVLDSRQPIMSPAWSSDGQWLAYASFANPVAAIVLQQMQSGRM